MRDKSNVYPFAFPVVTRSSLGIQRPFPLTHWGPMVELATDGACAQVEGQFEEGAVRVIVDRDRCEGNAVCLGIAPDIFDLDDEDYAVVKTDPIPPDREQLAEQAIAECPRAALLRSD
jgi:ferredoxin